MPEANMLVEKRVYPRVSINVPVNYQVIEDQNEIKEVLRGTGKDKNSHTLNVSLGGLYLVVDHILEKGRILRLGMSLPGISHLITAFAEVVWSNESDAGLRFLAIKEEDVEILNNCLLRTMSEK